MSTTYHATRQRVPFLPDFSACFRAITFTPSSLLTRFDTMPRSTAPSGAKLLDVYKNGVSNAKGIRERCVRYAASRHGPHTHTVTSESRHWTSPSHRAWLVPIVAPCATRLSTITLNQAMSPADVANRDQLAKECGVASLVSQGPKSTNAMVSAFVRCSNRHCLNLFRANTTPQ